MIKQPDIHYYNPNYDYNKMKSKSKQNKQIPAEKLLNLDLSWEKITDMENALRRITSNNVELPLNHDVIQNLIKFTKQIIKGIEALKSQSKHYENIQQNYNMIQSKLANHDSIVSSLQQHHMTRLKTLSDQIKNSKQYYEKAKKNLQESEQQARASCQEMKKQNTQLKYRIQILNKQRDDLLKQITQKNITIQNLQLYKQKFLKTSTQFTEAPPRYDDPRLSSILCSSLGSNIVAYLSPIEIVNLQLLNRQCRVYLTKSKKVQTNLSKSIIKVKDRKIAYYHKHIDYFQKLYHKIPQQILQFTFYRYEILKQNIGTQILNILNHSAMLFQGKFQDIDDEEFKQKPEKGEMDINHQKNAIVGNLVVNIQKQIDNIRQFGRQNPNNMLEIDEDIIREFLEDRRNSKQKLNKEISVMYSKIKTTAQLYSIDVESIGKFMTNILINFSKVFVLSKNLYAQARNLQSLNTLILRQLANWDKIQVQKNSQIEDLKAELQAQRKLRVFFTQKSMKSQQRALAEQNIRLGIETKYSKQSEKLDSICRQKQQIATKLTECQKDVKNLKSDNKQIRKAYQNGKQKYNQIMLELNVVKQIILRMNIM